MSNNKKVSVFSLTEAAVLSALIFIMAFTQLGYIPIGPAAMSLISIPVAVGAATMGPGFGAFFGFLFGLTSFIQALRGDLLGTILLEINPFFTVVTCFVPRILMGLFCGLIFKAVAGKPLEHTEDEAEAAKRRKKASRRRNAACFTAGISAPALNTLLFMATLLLLFYNNAQFTANPSIAGLMANRNIIGFTLAFVGVNALLELVGGAVIGTALIKAVLTAKNRMRI